MVRFTMLALGLAIVMPAAAEPWVRLDVEAKTCRTMVGKPLGSGGSEPSNRSVVEEVDLPDGSKKITYAVTGHGGLRTQVHFSSRSACEATLRELTAGQRIRVEKGQTFAQALRHKYKTRLHFVDIEAMRIVDNFNLPCPQPDGRYLPLTNVLFAKLAQADTPKAWLKIVADSHGGSVRIRDQLTGPSGPLDAPYVSMEVTGNGELRIFDGVRMEAILNSCFGVNGDIFVVPRRAAGAAK